MASTLDRNSPLVHPQQRRPCGPLLLQVGGECPRVYVHRVPGIAAKGASHRLLQGSATQLGVPAPLHAGLARTERLNY